MRKSSALFGAFALLAWLAGPASAAPLPVNGTLTVTIGTLGSLSLTGSGVGSSAGGIGSAATVPAGLFGLTAPASVPITPPALAFSLITLPASPGAPVLNDAGHFAPGAFPNGGTLGGAMGNNGIARLRTAFPDTTFCVGITCPLAGIVPLKYVGGGGTGMGFSKVVVATLPATLVGAVWNNLGAGAATPTRQLKIQNVALGVPMTITVTAFDKRTSGGVGTLQLVAPASAKLPGVPFDLGTLPVVGVLTLQFVPEPGTFVLVGSGIVGLVAVGRKRARG